MKANEYDGEKFRADSEFRRVRMTYETMQMASELQRFFRGKGDVPTSLEYVVECAIANLHEDLLQ